MPELPEVQTIINDLNKKIVGDTITGFWTDWPKTIKNLSVGKFTKEVKRRKIIRVRRMGKNIFIDLSGGKTLYIHLKMTGHLLVKTKSHKLKAERYFADKANQYIHHIWQLGKNKTLEFSDLRKFGKIILIETKKLVEIKEIRMLGIDAMSPDFTFNKLKQILSRRQNKPIGLALIEQELISGIGNIYRSELFFEAGVIPKRIIKSLNEAEIKNIYQAIKKVLTKAIKMRGTSDSDYRDTSGAPGNFQKVLKVYQREGQKCRKCGTIVKRIKMGQRSVFYCPKCQK